VAEVADRGRGYLVDLGVVLDADHRCDRRGRRQRIGKERIGQIPRELSFLYRADDLSLLAGNIRRVVDKLTNSRTVVVAGDEQKIVRLFARAFNGSCEKI